MVNNYSSAQLVLIQYNTSCAEVFCEKGVFEAPAPESLL